MMQVSGDITQGRKNLGENGLLFDKIEDEAVEKSKFKNY